MNLVIAHTNGSTPTIYTQTQLKKAAREVAAQAQAKLVAFYVRCSPYPVLQVNLDRAGYSFTSSLAI